MYEDITISDDEVTIIAEVKPVVSNDTQTAADPTRRHHRPRQEEFSQTPPTKRARRDWQPSCSNSVKDEDTERAGTVLLPNAVKREYAPIEDDQVELENTRPPPNNPSDQKPVKLEQLGGQVICFQRPRFLIVPSLHPDPNVRYTPSGQEMEWTVRPWSAPPAIGPIPELHDSGGAPVFKARNRTLDIRTWSTMDVLIWTGNFLLPAENENVHDALEEFEVDGEFLWEMVMGLRRNNLNLEHEKFDVIRRHAAAVVIAHNNES